MPQSAPPRLISCDEAGYTGPKLLDDNQPYFAYAAIDLTPEEAADIVATTRGKYKVQAPELKSSLLRKRENWPEIALDILGPLKGRVMVIAADKRLNLAGKTFEYIFEPVIQRWSMLFYSNDLHRFVMNALHRVFFKAGEPVPQLAEELQAFMKSFDPAHAPTVFAAAEQEEETNEVLDCVLRFARGYSKIIAEQSEHLQRDVNRTGKWTLDLTTTCLFSLIAYGWGYHHDRLDVLCDDSKPLEAMAHVFDGFVGNTKRIALNGPGGKPAPIKANLANPLRFGSSAENPTLQIADIVAGATTDLLQNQSDASYHELAKWLLPHMHAHSMFPDDDFIDLKRRQPRMNLAVLKELARRADAGEDPLAGMPEFYEALMSEERKKLRWLF
ncbi:DUF3800 domain-containing protein [Brucella intermedia]|uniref:DUF3800 domain-containing protein n=1 Tax=Brucella intermedia TaxID=94625 RepID=UPI00209BB21D|nr:DUF3800 domain-containing protein [Brucella intermedia]MCO7728852.1 DUF3800 domain-containing protein [Brucella intermedia]